MEWNVESLCDRADTHMDGEKWLDAVALLESEPSLTSIDYRLSWSLGWALFKLGRPAEAIGPLRTAISLKLEEATLHWALATVLADAGENEEAEREFLSALELREGYLPRIGLALLYLKQGRLHEAEQVYLNGMETHPRNRRKVEAYADFLSDVGRQDEAREFYELAATLPASRLYHEKFNV